MILGEFALYTWRFLDFIFFNSIFMFCDFFSSRRKYFLETKSKKIENITPIKTSIEIMGRGRVYEVVRLGQVQIANM
jgi:hypothetical protein